MKIYHVCCICQKYVLESESDMKEIKIMSLARRPIAFRLCSTCKQGEYFERKFGAVIQGEIANMLNLFTNCPISTGIYLEPESEDDSEKISKIENRKPYLDY